MSPDGPKPVDRVVVGVGGVDDRRALDWATEEAAAHRVPLVVRHCVRGTPEVSCAPDGAVLPVATAEQRPEQRPSPTAEAMLKALVGEVESSHPGLTVRGELLRGQPGPALSAAALPGDLLVLAPHSRHRVAARLLGSTSSFLLAHAPCAVAALGPGAADTGRGPFAGHVVAAVDTGAASAGVVELAYAEAAVHDCPLAVVHVQREHGEVEGVTVDERTLEVGVVPFPADHALLQAAVEPGRHRYPEVPVRRAAFRGPLPEVLRQAALGARLLVLGRPRHPSWPLHLVDLLLARPGCPVVVAPPPATT
ncbi:universal stress protein [Streptoalloteichus hindustanus]|uniref:Nucleotide-binding universal stress protein, UspA family n=1 Tax=Streptoalloteichus hindustanus TaxID=2017 RepID=A0A1M5DUQ6_STRHI|nr:universal stress protein [Streptoalloteichus hindustanus]SHF70571.1 Nucleotide-binding universal stress protein, UspA family [Streptoalloteichus hindustanus]